MRQKTKKYRGTLYGRGKKAGRGKGKRGGKGMAGLGKHRWIWMVKYDPEHYGSHGFVRHSIQRELKSINVGELDRNYEKYLEQGLAEVKDNKLYFDLDKLGYDVLLGGGKVGRAMIIKVNKATNKAMEKIKNSGGEVEIDGDKEE